MNKTIIIAAIVAFIIGGGVGYLIPHGATATQNARGNFAGGTGGFASSSGTFSRGGASANGGGLLTGTIAAASDGSITLNTRDGSSHVVLVTPDTTISKSVDGSASDLVNGDTIIVSGTTNSDGSISASLIQIRPATATADTPVSQ